MISKKFIMIVLFFITISLGYLQYNSEQKKDFIIQENNKILKMVNNIDFSKDKFSIKQTEEIIARKEFSEYLTVEKKKRKLIIVFKAPLKKANDFIRKLANSNALLGHMNISQQDENIHITIEVKQ